MYGLDNKPGEDRLKGRAPCWLIDFSKEAMGREFLGEGWSGSDPGYTWVVGSRAAIEFPAVSSEADHSLAVWIADVAGPVSDRVQRVRVTMNGSLLGEIVCRGESRFELFVPRAVTAEAKRNRLVFYLPDAVRPADFGLNDDQRFLSIGVTKVELMAFQKTGQPPSAESVLVLARREALLNMQSLGINCEFGFVQRLVGAEPLGLFRWGFTPLSSVVRAIGGNLQELGSPGSLEVSLDGNSEFQIHDKIFGLKYHSFAYATQGATAEAILKREYARLPFLVRNLLQELREASKLFVYHDAGVSSREDIERLVRALRQHGKNTLLWLTQASDPARVGCAEQIAIGLIQGSVSGFQLPVGHVVPRSEHQSSWLTASCRAYELWREFQETT